MVPKKRIWRQKEIKTNRKKKYIQILDGKREAIPNKKVKSIKEHLCRGEMKKMIKIGNFIRIHMQIFSFWKVSFSLSLSPFKKQKEKTKVKQKKGENHTQMNPFFKV